MINHPKQGYLTNENHNLRTLYDSRSHIAWNDSHIVGKFRDICMKSHSMLLLTVPTDNKSALFASKPGETIVYTFNLQCFVRSNRP